MPHDITLRRVGTSVLGLGALGLAGLAGAAEVAEPRLAALERQLAQVQTQLVQVVEESRSLRQAQQQLERRLAQLSLAAAAAPGAAGIPKGAAAPGAPAALVAGAAPAAASASQVLAAPPAAPPGPGAAEGPRLWGYGEVYYADPAHDGRRRQVDLARAVFGLGYSFDERTEFNSEFEVEHAVASASDVGEFDVEQFYVDRRLSDSVSARGGLFLMPFGLINEHHEPTRFYGVQRNFVETLVIPSTWREGGVSLHGNTPVGLGWNVGLTTGFDLSKWQFDSTFPPYASALGLATSGIAPLQATHQELALANGRHLTQYVAASYYGVPALLLGGAISTGKAAGISLPSGSGAAEYDPRITLWEAHARWTPAKLDLSALYARGSISNLGAVNAAHPGAANPVPSAFYGYLLQGAYELWEQGDYRAAPFVRFERYNLGASYSGTPGPVVPTALVPLSGSPGDLGYWPANHDRVWTAGANFYLGTHVVLKGDYQWFQLNSSFSRFDLGLGVSF